MPMIMYGAKTKRRFKEWLTRYFRAELLGTLLAVCFAYSMFTRTHSYALAAGAGWLGEGIGFYGYFIISELIANQEAYRNLPPLRRLVAVVTSSSSNLIVEFAPAEIVDNLLIRPLLMFYLPQHLKPYTLGFLVGKLAADALFYVFAILGYETKKHMRAR